MVITQRYIVNYKYLPAYYPSAMDDNNVERAKVLADRLEREAYTGHIVRNGSTVYVETERGGLASMDNIITVGQDHGFAPRGIIGDGGFDAAVRLLPRHEVTV